MTDRTFKAGDRVQVAAVVPGNVKPWRHGTVRGISATGNIVKVEVLWDGRASAEIFAPCNLIHAPVMSFSDPAPSALPTGATEGEQTLVGGTPQRIMPSTPLRAKRRQADLRDTPLFGQDRAAVERSQEELPL